MIFEVLPMVFAVIFKILLCIVMEQNRNTLFGWILAAVCGRRWEGPARARLHPRRFPEDGAAPELPAWKPVTDTDTITEFRADGSSCVREIPVPYADIYRCLTEGAKKKF